MAHATKRSNHTTQFTKGKDKMQLRSRKTAILTAFAIATTLGSIHSSAQNTNEQPDKYQWLEDVDSARSMTWVEGQNARSAARLENDR